MVIYFQRYFLLQNLWLTPAQVCSEQGWLAYVITDCLKGFKCITDERWSPVEEAILVKHGLCLDNWHYLYLLTPCGHICNVAFSYLKVWRMIGRVIFASYLTICGSSASFSCMTFKPVDTENHNWSYCLLITHACFSCNACHTIQLSLLFCVVMIITY